ncbi:MAG: hypothetical protein JWM22_615, partial [Frankiales bacterium]|nr:hypothetical protein [Frankiales bacterium]
YQHQAAIDLFDAWWDPVGAGVSDSAALPKDVLRGTLGSLVDKLPMGLDDHPRQGIGSSWNGVAWYGYVSKDLRQVLGQPVQGRYSRTYCGKGVLATCRSQLLGSLRSAATAAMAAEKVGSVDALTYDKSKDFIRSVTAGVVGVRGIDWQNRPTFQQAVKLTTHRPRTQLDAAGPVPHVGGLPSTGLGELPLVALLVLSVAMALRRRRPSFAPVLAR